MICLPYSRLEPLPAGVTYSNVWEEVVVVVGNKGVCEESPERMFWTRGKYVVAQGAAAPVGRPGWVIKERSKVLEASLEINMSVEDQRRRVRRGIFTLSRSRYMPPKCCSAKYRTVSTLCTGCA